jgi:NAD(P)-dependent dehydrogenase (short-subunit alcohol dehydrogenase family)
MNTSRTVVITGTSSGIGWAWQKLICNWVATPHNIKVNAVAPGIVDTPMHSPENRES